MRIPKPSLVWYADMARDWQELADDLADVLEGATGQRPFDFLDKRERVLARYHKAERL
jgi:hypothetical protein